MTTQLVLDFGEDARTTRRPLRPTVPAGAGLRAVKTPTAQKATAATKAAERRTVKARERLRPAQVASSVAPAPNYWRLDERTRAIGVRGVEEARRVLAGIPTGHAA